MFKYTGDIQIDRKRTTTTKKIQINPYDRTIYTKDENVISIIWKLCNSKCTWSALLNTRTQGKAFCTCTCHPFALNYKL